MRIFAVDVDRNGAAVNTVLAMCCKVGVLVRFPFEKKQMKKVATR